MPVVEKQQAARGLECPKCGCRHLFRVRETDRTVGGRILRRRECRNCGHRFTTVEMVADDLANDSDKIRPGSGNISHRRTENLD